MEITLSYPLWYLLGVLLLSGGLAALLYVNNKKNKEVTKSVTGLLFTLRFLTLFTVLFLLLKPLIKHLSSRIEKPIIAIAIDNSESIKMAVDSVKLQEVLNNISALK